MSNICGSRTCQSVSNWMQGGVNPKIISVGALTLIGSFAIDGIPSTIMKIASLVAISLIGIPEAYARLRDYLCSQPRRRSILMMVDLNTNSPFMKGMEAIYTEKYKLSRKWFTKAVNDPDIEPHCKAIACWNAAQHYYYGRGGKQDVEKAKEMFRKVSLENILEMSATTSTVQWSGSKDRLRAFFLDLCRVEDRQRLQIALDGA